MADISKDLQDYLSKNSKTERNSSNNIASGISTYVPNVSNWLSKKNETKQSENNDGWLAKAQSDPFFPALSRKQRIIGFMGCLAMGCTCFTLATLYIPFLILKARKFALLYTLGSLFIVMSFGILWGPVNHIKHLCSTARLPFTAAYFGTMLATLYFALELKSTPFTVLFAVLQLIALLWYLVSYIPGGQTGLSVFTKLFSKSVVKTLPV